MSKLTVYIRTNQRISELSLERSQAQIEMRKLQDRLQVLQLREGVLTKKIVRCIDIMGEIERTV